MDGLRSICVGMGACTLVSCVSLQDERAEAPIAFLNHFFIVVDDDLADAIAVSEVLNDFGVFSVQTVDTGNGRTWTGRYLSGCQTYLEVFKQSDTGDEILPPVGQIGLALSGDRLGVLSELDLRLSNLGVATVSGAQNRLTDEGETVDWYVQLYLDYEFGAPSFFTWAMEYEAAYLDRFKEVAEGPADVVSRERYQDDVCLEFPMRDITGFAARVNREDFLVERPMFEAAGFKFHEFDGGVRLATTDADVTLLFDGAAEIGVQSIFFQLNGPVDDITSHKIGDSTLTIGPGDTATWSLKN